ncbi:MAG TPA: secretin N-terminal domain-containing protein [Phycisphaerae bacterium]|nr:secretin N-terminal domain-containing protein [Phycisphaerae bacterium]
MEAQGKRPPLEIALLEDGAVEIEGPLYLIRHVNALVGLDGPPNRARAASGATARRERGPDRREARPEGRAADRAQREARRAEGDAGRAKSESRREKQTADFVVGIFALKHARASSVARLADILSVGSPHPWAAKHDTRTNTVIVNSTPDMVERAGRLIKELDRPVADPDGVQTPVVTRLIPLSHAEARTLAEVVSRVSRRAYRELDVVPDLWTNTLVLAGPKQQVDEAASLIKSLDISPAANKAGPKPAPPAAKGKKKPEPKAGKGDKKPKPKPAPGKDKKKPDSADAKKGKPKPPPAKPVQPKPPAAVIEGGNAPTDAPAAKDTPAEVEKEAAKSKDNKAGPEAGKQQEEERQQKKEQKKEQKQKQKEKQEQKKREQRAADMPLTDV